MQRISIIIPGGSIFTIIGLSCIKIDVEHKDRDVEISIANSGEPIPEKDIPLIFDQFFRVEKSRSHQYGGTGLGLTIVKKIVELHGGSVGAGSSSDQTVITLILPLIEFTAYPVRS